MVITVEALVNAENNCCFDENYEYLVVFYCCNAIYFLRGYNLTLQTNIRQNTLSR